jgi:hypothetical protein
VAKEKKCNPFALLIKLIFIILKEEDFPIQLFIQDLGGWLKD